MTRRIPLVVRALLRLYPAPFRERYGDAMNVFYAERFANPGPGRIRMWRRVLGDLVVSVILEHVRVRRDAEPHDSSARPRLSTEDQMSVIVQELVYAARSLRKSVSFSAAALFTLALGISSTTAIFSVVESVLLAPLPFPAADRIVVPESRNMKTGDTCSCIAYADFMDWRDNHVFDKVAVFQTTQMDLTGPDEEIRS